MKVMWYKRRDKTTVCKVGKWILLEIFKRPHKGYCCMVFDKGRCVAINGYFSVRLPKKYHAVRWGGKTARELKLWPT